MSVAGADFTIIKFKIYLTWQPPIMISVVLQGLWLSQYTCNFWIPDEPQYVGFSLISKNQYWLSQASLVSW